VEKYQTAPETKFLAKTGLWCIARGEQVVHCPLEKCHACRAIMRTKASQTAKTWLLKRTQFNFNFKKFPRDNAPMAQTPCRMVFFGCLLLQSPVFLIKNFNTTTIKKISVHLGAL
jgi:hypothetical protein